MLHVDDSVRVLDGRQARFLSRHQQMVLAGMHLPLLPAEMAERFECSESTIVRVRRQTMEEVFDFTEIEGTYERLRLWAERHWGCCTAASSRVGFQAAIPTEFATGNNEWQR